MKSSPKWRKKNNIRLWNSGPVLFFFSYCPLCFLFESHSYSCIKCTSLYTVPLWSFLLLSLLLLSFLLLYPSLDSPSTVFLPLCSLFSIPLFCPVLVSASFVYLSCLPFSISISLVSPSSLSLSCLIFSISISLVSPSSIYPPFVSPPLYPSPFSPFLSSLSQLTLSLSTPLFQFSYFHSAPSSSVSLLFLIPFSPSLRFPIPGFLSFVSLFYHIHLSTPCLP